MAIGILSAIGAVIYGVGKVLGKTWEVTKDFVGWLFSVMPKPLKFFVFLYMIIFLITLLMPKFLGTGFECDTNGNVYKINFIKMYATGKYVDNLAIICGAEEDEEPLTELPTFVDMVLTFIDWFKGIFTNIPGFWNIYNSYAISDTNMTQAELCYAWRTAISTNQTPTKDFVLINFGERLYQRGYEQVVHVGCSRDNDGEWYQTLHLYNLDLFNFEMWLLIGLVGALVPFAFRWYRIVLKR